MTLPLMFYSRFLIICCVLFGCSSLKKNKFLDQSSLDYLKESQELACNDPELDSYLQTVSKSLQIPLRRGKKYDIRVTKQFEPYSIFIAPATIIISSGFLQRLPFEASLAFVLAHEISHDINGEDEYLADQFALDLVIRAGYNYPAALEALKKFSANSSIHDRNLVKDRLSALSFNPTFEQLFYGRTGEYKFRKMRERCNPTEPS